MKYREHSKECCLHYEIREHRPYANSKEEYEKQAGDFCEKSPGKYRD